MPVKNENLEKTAVPAAPAKTPLAPPKPNGSSGAILIADDNKDDATHAKKIVEKLHLQVSVHGVFSGEEVLAYLEGHGRYANRADYPYPVLLLLDLRMPGWDGFEVLTWLKNHPNHRALPVVVLSVVRELPMISRAYQLGARSFLIKPLTQSEITRTIRALVILPEADTAAG